MHNIAFSATKKEISDKSIQNQGDTKLGRFKIDSVRY